MYKPKRNQMSFYDKVYETTVPRNHFLRKLECLIDWHSFEQKLAGLYQNQGRLAHNPVLMFKALCLQFLYDLSDRKLEEHIIGFMPFRFFLGLDPLDSPPDHTAYCRFRDRLGEDKIAELFNAVVTTARSKRLVSERLSIVDATHVRAKVNTYKMNRKSDDDKPDGPKSSVDPDATYGHKNKNEPFFGYKAAVAMDADSGIITKTTATTGREHDSRHFVKVCDIQARGTTADKGYDVPENFAHLKAHGRRAAIIPKRRRGRKKGHVKARYWLCKDRLWYYINKKHRPRVERFFGLAKRSYGLRQARYWGLAKMKLQVMFTAMAINLKRMVTLVDRCAQNG